MPTKPIRSLTLKAFLIGILAVLLIIPLLMVHGLIQERAARRDDAVEEVSSTWGRPQEIVGPVLVVPYMHGPDRHLAYFLPAKLAIKGTIDPQRRSRGLYQAVVYSLPGLSLSGSFAPPCLEALELDPEKVLWGEVSLMVGIPDARGLQRDVTLTWGDRQALFQPGTRSRHVATSGIHAPIGAGEAWTSGDVEFSFSLDLQGSSHLSFAALGESVTANLGSSWPHPSFSGAFLPTQRTIADDGFEATWQISRFGTDLPQAFTRGSIPSSIRLREASFGLRLFVPVDSYQRSVRAVKYGFLIITLTFLTFFLFEILSGLSVHPLQYLMVGAALCLFFLLYLALSEHIGFFAAYGLATAGVVGLITGYSVAVLETQRRAGILMTVLLALYGFLFVLLTNEEYALLLGSLTLFVILAAVMYLTRRIDWGGKPVPAGGDPAPETGSIVPSPEPKL